MNVRYVAQPNGYGCAIACVAMIVDVTYQEMEDWFVANGLTPARMANGIHSFIYFEALGRHGFTYVERYANDPIRNELRPNWPPEPFAPIHIASAAVSSGNHAFVMLEDGTVLDPYKPDRTTIRHPDYLQVHHVAGVWQRP